MVTSSETDLQEKIQAQVEVSVAKLKSNYSIVVYFILFDSFL